MSPADVTAIKNELSQFTGTEGYHRGLTALYTDGIVWVAEKLGCWWLFDDSAAYIHGYEKTDQFAVLRLTINDDESFIVELGDGNDIWRKHFASSFTGFPKKLTPFEFYAQWSPEMSAWIFMLKSEY